MRHPIFKTLCLAAVSGLALSSATAQAADKVYADFPVTVKGYDGKKTTSVSYTGQIARQTLQDSLKKLAGKGNGKSNAALEAEMLAYFEGKDAGRAIIAPASKNGFAIKQSGVDDISKKKNLAGKTYKGVINGMPNGMTGPELVKFWIGKAATATKGVDKANGYNYPQLISKFLMGAVMYNQAVDNYLDEKLAADTKPNDKPYKDGAAYTGKEHVWDEAFGYFGAPAHGLSLDSQTLYAITKQKPDALKAADANGDGMVDLKSEMMFGPAYYAAGADKSGKTSYFNEIVTAFIDGRQVITNAKGNKLSDAERNTLTGYASVIEDNWEKTLAEATFKYAGSVYKDLGKLETILDANGDIAKAEANYIKHWGELKGFSLALQTGRKNHGELFTRLNRLIGYGPVLPSASQVVDLDRKGNYLRDEAISFAEYRLHMLKVQKALADQFGIKARSNDMLTDMAELVEKMANSGSAEND